MGSRGRTCKQLLDDHKEKRGSTRSHSVENSLWKRLWSCRKTDNRMNDHHENLKSKMTTCYPTYSYCAIIRHTQKNNTIYTYYHTFCFS